MRENPLNLLIKYNSFNDLSQLLRKMSNMIALHYLTFTEIWETF